MWCDQSLPRSRDPCPETFTNGSPLLSVFAFLGTFNTFFTFNFSRRLFSSLVRSLFYRCFSPQESTRQLKACMNGACFGPPAEAHGCGSRLNISALLEQSLGCRFSPTPFVTVLAPSGDVTHTRSVLRIFEAFTSWLLLFLDFLFPAAFSALARLQQSPGWGLSPTRYLNFHAHSSLFCAMLWFVELCCANLCSTWTDEARIDISQRLVA